ncbi:MAG TPA: sulfatase, partial [Firmicutes bacterium]|nr:sulfatase [Bacillota bacterium]
MKNVILITLDATRKDVFGIYGNNKGLSPFIDSLKDKSLIFNNCYSTGPYTQSAFPGILTSSHYLDYGRPNNSALDPRRTVISEPLQKAGIITAGFHSNPYCSSYFGWDRGWDKFYDSMEEDLPPRVPYIQGPRVNEMTFNWLRSPQGGKSGKPFFLWVHYMDIHEPYNPEQKYIDMVYPEIKITQDEMAELQQKVVLKRDVSDPKTVELLKKLYDVHVREVDGYVKDLFETLEKEGILKDTIVILTADHGDEFNEHGGLSHDHKGY